MRLIRAIGGSLINPAHIEEVRAGRDKGGRHLIHAYFASGRGRTLAVYETEEEMAAHMDALRLFLESNGEPEAVEATSEAVGAPCEAVEATSEASSEPAPSREPGRCPKCGRTKTLSRGGKRMICRPCMAANAVANSPFKRAAPAPEPRAAVAARPMAEPAAAAVAFDAGLDLTPAQREFVRQVAARPGQGDFVVTTTERGGHKKLRFSRADTVDPYAEQVALVVRDGDRWQALPALDGPEDGEDRDGHSEGGHSEGGGPDPEEEGETS